MSQIKLLTEDEVNLLAGKNLFEGGLHQIEIRQLIEHIWILERMLDEATDGAWRG